MRLPGIQERDREYAGVFWTLAWHAVGFAGTRPLGDHMPSMLLPPSPIHRPRAAGSALYPPPPPSLCLPAVRCAHTHAPCPLQLTRHAPAGHHETHVQNLCRGLDLYAK